MCPVAYGSWFVVVLTSGDCGEEDLKFHFEYFFCHQAVQQLLYNQKYQILLGTTGIDSE